MTCVRARVRICFVPKLLRKLGPIEIAEPHVLDHGRGVEEIIHEIRRKSKGKFKTDFNVSSSLPIRLLLNLEP
jgi:hypothetical protein